MSAPNTSTASVARAASVDVDAEEERVDLWLRLPPEHADARGLAAVSRAVEETIRRTLGSGYRIRTRDDASSSTAPAFALRRGLGGGLSVDLWLESAVLRVRAKVESRLQMVWGCFSLAVGFLAYVFVSCGFSAALAPHLTILRHAGKLGFFSGILIALAVALLTWIPLRVATRRGRRESFRDAEALVREVAAALERLR